LTEAEIKQLEGLAENPMPKPVARTSRFWLFKCNPQDYRIADRMAGPNPTITWRVTRYAKDMAPGDTVFLMATGTERSIRGVLRIDAGPQDMAELESEQEYNTERDTEVRCRVRCTITHRQVDLPIEELKSVTGLENLSIFHGWQQATNFPVSDSEGRLLLSLVEATRSTKG
jgi:predicted RNA-binding protein with PUA-like domain